MSCVARQKSFPVSKFVSHQSVPPPHFVRSELWLVASDFSGGEYRAKTLLDFVTHVASERTMNFLGLGSMVVTDDIKGSDVDVQ